LSNGFKFTPLVIFDGVGTCIIKSLKIPNNVEIIFLGKEIFSQKKLFLNFGLKTFI